MISLLTMRFMKYEMKGKLFFMIYGDHFPISILLFELVLRLRLVLMSLDFFFRILNWFCGFLCDFQKDCKLIFSRLHNNYKKSRFQLITLLRTKRLKMQQSSRKSKHATKNRQSMTILQHHHVSMLKPNEHLQRSSLKNENKSRQHSVYYRNSMT